MPGNQLNDEIERALFLTRERRTKVSNSMITGITVLIYSSWEFTITQWKSLLKAIHSFFSLIAGIVNFNVILNCYNSTIISSISTIRYFTK